MNQEERRTIRSEATHFASEWRTHPGYVPDWDALPGHIFCAEEDALHSHPAHSVAQWPCIMRGEQMAFHPAHSDVQILTSDPTSTPQSQYDLYELKQQVEELQRNLSDCLDLLSKLSDHASDGVVHRTAAINSIIVDNTDIILKRPLFFLIEEYEGDDEVVARIPELQAAGFGSTEIQAINELKTLLGELYQDLIETPDEKLGKLPFQWKRILQEVIGINAREKLQR